MPQYVLLPARGVRVRSSEKDAFSLMMRGSGARSTLPAIMASLPRSPTKSITVIDSIHEDGPKLIETGAENLVELKRHGLKAVPLIEYGLAPASRFQPTAPAGAASGPDVVVRVVDASTLNPVAGATVTAFILNDEGAQGVTDTLGEVRLKLGGASPTAQRLFVEAPLAGYWGKFLTNVTIPLTVHLKPADPSFTDALNHFYPIRSLKDGKGVRIGIVDTGVDTTHPDLSHIIHGSNVARGEPVTGWQDNGLGHGTHVAGIIAGRGRMTGLAPAAELHCFRAFGKNKNTTTNYEILKGLIRACDAECHIVNLSLSAEPRMDETLRQGIEAAREQGILVIAAAGNSGRKSPTIPGSFASNDGICVSAFGRKGCLPPDAFEHVDVAAPFGASNPDDFLAAFTNVKDITLTAPGVGIISTVPGGYGPMSGTSMACPAVTGAAARILARDLATAPNPVLKRNPDTQRTIDMITMITGHATSVFADPNVEGDGLLA